MRILPCLSPAHTSLLISLKQVKMRDKLPAKMSTSSHSKGLRRISFATFGVTSKERRGEIIRRDRERHVCVCVCVCECRQKYVDTEKPKQRAHLHERHIQTSKTWMRMQLSTSFVHSQSLPAGYYKSLYDLQLHTTFDYPRKVKRMRVSSLT